MSIVTELPEVPPGFPFTIVLGIDPGTLVTGYGALVMRPNGPVLLASGVMRLPKKEAMPVRLAYLQSELEGLMERLKPDVVVVEEAFAARNVQSALRIGEGRGVVLATAIRARASVVQFPPAVAKKAVVGNGRADKSQIARMVAADLKLDTLPETLDASDALALALAYVRRSRLSDQIEKKERHA